MTDDKWITASDADSSKNDDWDKKEPIEGEYLSKKENIGKYDSTVYTLKVGDKKVSVWGSAVIDGAFEEIPKGSKVRIEPKGTAPSDKGNDIKLFDIKYQKPSEDKPEEEKAGDIPL